MQNQNNEEIKIYRNRLIVSDLIFDVLSDKKTVSQALSLFPKDKNDINLKCAFDALMYREADEDLRKKVQDYALVQDEFLSDIAFILKENRPMPLNIIEQYQKYNKSDLIPDEKEDLKTVFKKIIKMINF